MTRKDFERIARAMQSVCPSDNSTAFAQWRRTLQALSAEFAKDNSQFNPRLFAAACVPNGMMTAH